VRTKTLLRSLPYIAGILFAALALASFEISNETASMFDAQPGALTDSVDVQVFWLQGKACVVQEPGTVFSYVSSCSYLPMINVMLALTILLVAVLVLYGLLRKRVTLLPTKRKHMLP